MCTKRSTPSSGERVGCGVSAEVLCNRAEENGAASVSPPRPVPSRPAPRRPAALHHPRPKTSLYATAGKPRDSPQPPESAILCDEGRKALAPIQQLVPCTEWPLSPPGPRRRAKWGGGAPPSWMWPTRLATSATPLKMRADDLLVCGAGAWKRGGGERHMREPDEARLRTSTRRPAMRPRARHAATRPRTRHAHAKWALALARKRHAPARRRSTRRARPRARTAPRRAGQECPLVRRPAAGRRRRPRRPCRAAPPRRDARRGRAR